MIYAATLVFRTQVLSDACHPSAESKQSAWNFWKQKKKKKKQNKRKKEKKKQTNKQKQKKAKQLYQPARQKKKINLNLDIWWGNGTFWRKNKTKQKQKTRKPHPLVRLKNKIITHLRSWKKKNNNNNNNKQTKTKQLAAKNSTQLHARWNQNNDVRQRWRVGIMIYTCFFQIILWPNY